MSAPRLISPLLDNFVMGEPIFDKGGIRILPAMEQEKEEKYIVKIVSIPANQSQVDALLITGAYKNTDEVNAYFAELADAVIAEAGTLNRLSNAGGFCGYEDMQVVPMDDGNGYEVYLLAPYRPTWARISQQKSITHLDGYNLALDICAALSVARRNGYIYANLTPDSVSVAPSGSYHICDLGLIGLDYLQYSSLPTAYFSAYTAPEVSDAFSALNSTLDVYALGMILYEIFNGGLPFDGSQPSASDYAAPAFADEEFAQIILKAISPNPEGRWQDPTQMGQAIVGVMQRNGVSDAPILPVVQIAEVPEEATAEVNTAETIEEAQTETAVEDEPAVDPVPEVDTDLNCDKVEIETPDAANNEQSCDSCAEEVVADSTNAEEPADAASTVSEDASDTLSSEAAEEVVDEPAAETAEAPVTDVMQEAEEAVEEQIPVAEDPETVMHVSDETPTSDNELDEILEEANNLIADLDGEVETINNVAFEQIMIDEVNDETATEPHSEISEEGEDESYAPPRSGKRKVAIACSIILLALLVIGGLFFYRHIYMQEIDIFSVSGKADAITVAVVTEVPSDKLVVVCIDENGNRIEARLVDYKATITGLAAETNYTVSLEIDGFHKLFGQTEYNYTTPVQTVITDLAVLNGKEAGSAEVSFQVTGPNEGNWTVTFTAANEAPHSATVIDGKAVITGLTLGTAYDVTISSSADLYLGENAPISFAPGAVIRPINPHVLSCIDGKLTVQWFAPEDVADLSWTVRCFNDGGFDEVITVNGTTAVFNLPDEKKAYSIEVSAEGQSTKETLNVTQNAITFSDFEIDTSLPGRITLKWSANADVPEGGYVVTYLVDGVQVDTTLKTDGNSVTIISAVPDAEHTFYFACANGESVLCAPITVTATGKNPFSAFGVKASNMRFNLCPRPDKNNWTYKDVSASSYTTTFSVGQKAGVAARILSRYYTSEEIVSTVYVFRNAENRIVHVCFTKEEWGDMWINGYGTLDIPSLPGLPGTYKLDMFIDGGLVHQTNITIK